MPTVKIRRSKAKGHVTQATLKHALARVDRIEAEQASLLARLSELGGSSSAPADLHGLTKAEEHHDTSPTRRQKLTMNAFAEWSPPPVTKRKALPPIRPPPRSSSFVSDPRLLRASYAAALPVRVVDRRGGRRRATDCDAEVVALTDDEVAAAAVSSATVARATRELKAALLANLQRVIDGFRALDVNGDGRVSSAEFCNAVGALPALASYTRAELAALFGALDDNHSGSLDFHELRTLLRRDDVTLAAELQDGAMGEIVLESKNQIEIRSTAGGTEQDRAAAILQARVRGRQARAHVVPVAEEVAEAAEAEAEDEEAEAARRLKVLAALEAFRTRRAADTMQRHARRWVASYRMARIIQTRARGARTRKARKAEDAERRAAATSVQAAYRGRLTRADMGARRREEAAQQARASQLLQAQARGHQARVARKKQLQADADP